MAWTTCYNSNRDSILSPKPPSERPKVVIQSRKEIPKQSTSNISSSRLPQAKVFTEN